VAVTLPRASRNLSVRRSGTSHFGRPPSRTRKPRYGRLRSPPRKGCIMLDKMYSPGLDTARRFRNSSPSSTGWQKEQSQSLHSGAARTYEMISSRIATLGVTDFNSFHFGRGRRAQRTSCLHKAVRGEVLLGINHRFLPLPQKH
jgi:hypothetical protein